MLGIVNEPVQNSATAASMIASFYPNAYSVSATLHSKCIVFTNTHQGNPLSRIISRHNSQQLPARRDDEFPLGQRQPHLLALQHLFHSLRRPPLPEIHVHSRLASGLPLRVMQRQPQLRQRDTHHRGRVLHLSPGRRAVHEWLGDEHAAVVL